MMWFRHSAASLSSGTTIWSRRIAITHFSHIAEHTHQFVVVNRQRTKPMKCHVLVLLFAILSTNAYSEDAKPNLPNILWIFAEDTSPWMGCYGDAVNKGKTPNIDSIASAGVIFNRAFVPAPVCSPCRSAMMAGRNQIRFGAHEHRSSRGSAKIHLPKGMKLLPQIMKEKGFFTFNRGKTDYNFVWDSAATYSSGKFPAKENFGKILKEKQPFFGQIQTKGGKTNTRKFPTQRKTDPNSVTVPPDYPQNQIYREVVAQHYDAIRSEDDAVGKILKGLKEAGLSENTIVVYFSDHGANNLLRHKQMVTEGGLHVPFMVKGPEKYVPQKKVRNDLVNMLDLTATTLAWAGIERPDWYEGQDLFSADHKEREFVGSAKDRLDHTLGRSRSVRTDRFRYTRNYKLDRIFLQPQYRDRKQFTKNLHELYAAGKLSPKLREIYFGERQPEELYDVSKDPHQMNNLVNDPAFKGELERHRKVMDAWLAKGDMGEGEESVEEMKYNADGKKWGTGVNPEYEVYRQDSDGDGLSDVWEKANGRDPKDGRLVFNFDCGGWQTEGWKPVGINSNIAGFLGYLDFPLQQGIGAIQRQGLSAASNENDQTLAIKMRSSADLEVRVSANGKAMGGAQKLAAGKAFADIRLKLANNPKWNGKIQSLKIGFVGSPGAFVEIDSIAVKRAAKTN
jgi:N-sulfoglucosamine sulfohydrolase